MSSMKERLLHLNHCRGIGWQSTLKLLQADPTLASIYSLSSEAVSRLLNIPQINANLFLKDLHSLKNQDMLRHYSGKNVTVLTVFDHEYPELLRQIYDPPWVVYLQGNKKVLTEQKKLSVVGTRNPTTYGLDCMEGLLSPLINDKWVIVSGLAEGIDAKAHKLTLSNNGSTIAVIAGGFNHIYPRVNLQLAKRLIEKNLLLSEYPPATSPQRWQFPMRNRIISGLSYGTLIIEAKERSGSLITANLALGQGREVFAVPGPINAPTSTGTNQLIQAGAKLVLTSEDILSEFSYL